MTLLRLVAVGCYSFDHPCEEAEIIAIAGALRTLTPRMEVTFISQKPSELRKLPGVRAVYRWNPLLILYTLIRSDMVFSCGKDSLRDTQGLGPLFAHFLTLFIARLLGKPLGSYAQGVGPLQSFWGRKLTAIICNKMALLTVRDQDSRKELSKIGVNRPPVVVTGDPIYSLNPSQCDKELGKTLLEEIRSADTGTSLQLLPHGEGRGEDGEAKPLLGVFLHELKGNRDYKRQVTATLDHLAREGWEILLLPFTYPEDQQICKELSLIMQERSLIPHKELTLKELFCLLGQADLILGMSLPTLVMGSLMRVPSLGIIVGSSPRDFLERVGQPPGIRIEDLEAEKLYRRLTSLYRERQEIVSRLDQVLIHLRQRSWESAGMLLSFYYSRFPQKRYGAARAAGGTGRHKTNSNNR